MQYTISIGPYLPIGDSEEDHENSLKPHQDVYKDPMKSTTYSEQHFLSFFIG